jgi:hypothetical protein
VEDELLQGLLLLCLLQDLLLQLPTIRELHSKRSPHGTACPPQTRPQTLSQLPPKPFCPTPYVALPNSLIPKTPLFIYIM